MSKVSKSFKSLSLACASAMLFVGLGASAGVLPITNIIDTPERCKFNDNNLPPETDCHYDPISNSQQCTVIDWCPEPDPINE